MLKKIIDSIPTDANKPFSHLEPIVDFLLNNGNQLCHEQKFFLDKDGWRADFKYPIDFDSLLKNFEFPKSIVLSKEHNSILCKNTWVEIKGHELR